MKKRLDEKFNILTKLGQYGLKFDMLETMYLKSIHKKHQITIWLHYPKPQEPNTIAINQHHEVRTEKDIVRYFTVLFDKLIKKYKPLEEKRKVCIVNFKGNNIKVLSAVSLLDAVKYNLTQIMSIHFFKENSTQPLNENSDFSYYVFALKLDEDKHSTQRDAVKM